MSQSFRPAVSLDAGPDLLTMTTVCAEGFVDQPTFENYIRHTINEASASSLLILTQVIPSWAEDTLASLEKSRDGLSVRKNYNSVTKILKIVIRPTWVHNCVQEWWHETEISMRESGDLTAFEQRQFMWGVGTTLQFTSGPYRSSQKEPDYFIVRKEALIPSFVIECGWSESLDLLRDDMNLLLVGGNGDITTVIIVKWESKGETTTTTRRIAGFVEVYKLDKAGNPVLAQREQIFPAPAQPSPPQILQLSRQDVFGTLFVPDPARVTPPSTMVRLDVEDLRQVARVALAKQNLIPE